MNTLLVNPWPDRIRAVLVMALAVLAAAPVHAIDPDELLDVDDAFVLSAGAAGPDRIRINWAIAEGYYLYRHALTFAPVTPEAALGQPDIPSGKAYHDEFFGDVETYRDSLAVTVPLREVATDAARMTLEIGYQGCADLGVCYPPQKRSVTVALPAAGSGDNVAGAGTGPYTSPGQGGGTIGEVLKNIGDGAGGIVTGAEGVLPAAEAFRYEAIATDPATLLVRMTPAEGYYLYREKFRFSVPQEGVQVRLANLPPGQPKRDEYFGDVRVYTEQVEIPVALQRSDPQVRNIELAADFQGCKDQGICYPPMQRRVSIELPPLPADYAGLEVAGNTLAAGGLTSAEQAIAAATGGGSAQAAPPATEQDSLAATLAARPVFAMLLFFIAGLLLAFTPCVFPMVPILSGIIAGQGSDITTRKAFWLSLVYVLAMALTYAAAGVIAGLSGENLQAAFQNPWIIVSFSLLFVLLALSMFGFYELQLPASWQSRLAALSNRQQGGNLFGVAVMGFLSALIVGPCVAPALMAALIYIGQSGDALLGGTALFTMALGMGAPLMAFGVSAGKLLPRAGPWMNGVKAFFGAGLLALAIWMLERILDGRTIMLLWAMLLIGSAVYLGVLEQAAYGWARLRKAAGVVALAFGLMQLAGFAGGGDDWTRPLEVWTGGRAAEARQELAFRRIKSVEDLQASLGRGQPVMLDFYADWCVECKRMEKSTFEDPGVQQALGDMLLLQADVTANDDTDKRLYRSFGLIGPPAILFFDAGGNELSSRRVIGYLDSEDFLRHLQTLPVQS